MNEPNWTPTYDSDQMWLCLWQVKAKKYLMNSSGEYLCMESRDRFNDVIESKMLAAARNLGITEGRAVWVPGRKVSDMEHDVQMERLLDGKVPDEAEALKEMEQQ